ncbi:natural cytotoxicity triggering receptor 2-like isoform X2 [Myotis daubentonii]|uniref:natural cytotoxicity triggering receptor 2-like isoform X2 n=1 Tax=Myotis daubentonii TaxID=98922 RepID=UPI002873CF0E|nr:natural cytotoxicity triggering receptor 2-like isoform X2 [Myotis daubentonii]
MAWEAPYLPPLVLLLLLASGSWEQQPLLLQKLEGEEVFVRCDYPPQNSSKTKTWCRVTSAATCTLLVNQPRLGKEPENPRYVISDYPGQGYFTVNMTALAEKDSGLYSCGLHESSRINILRTVSLAVSRGLPPALALSELQVMVIVLTCGFILNKSLLISVLFVLLRKARASGEPNPGEQQSHPSRS